MSKERIIDAAQEIIGGVREERIQELISENTQALLQKDEQLALKIRRAQIAETTMGDSYPPVVEKLREERVQNMLNLIYEQKSSGE